MVERFLAKKASANRGQKDVGHLGGGAAATDVELVVAVEAAEQPQQVCGLID